MLHNKGKDKKDHGLSMSDITRIMALFHDELLTIKDVAGIFQISEDGVRKRIYRGQVKAKKDGKKWYFLKSDIMGGFLPLARA